MSRPSRKDAGEAAPAARRGGAGSAVPAFWECSLDDVDEFASTRAVQLDALAHFRLACSLVGTECAQVKQPGSARADNPVLAVNLRRVHLDVLLRIHESADPGYDPVLVL